MDAAGEVVDRLREGGVDARLRKLPGVSSPETPSREIDLWLPRRSVREADRILVGHGFHRLVAPGHGDHRFWVTCADGGWTKLDAKLVPARRIPHRWSRLARQLPLAPRRAGPVVAFLGPDGAGKSTVVGRVASALPVATTVVYLGVRKGPQAAQGQQTKARAARPRRRSGPRAAIREVLFVVHRAARRQVPALVRAYRQAWKGRVVLCDRHPLDALAVDARRTQLGRAVERVVVGRLLPRPDLVVILDVPAEEMFARKHEHDVERLQRWRRAYHDELVPRGAHVLPATGSPEEVAAVAARLVWDALARRRRWSINPAEPAR